jgi:cation:H+ antiporter
MELMLSFLLVAIGFALLIKAADYLVDGAAALAVRFSMSEIVIGLTIVSFGTSAPELIVNVIASIRGKSEITLGNVIGSNIINTLLILGVAGLISSIKLEKNTVWREIPFSLLAAIVLFIACNDMMLDGQANLLSRVDGIMFLLFFVIFVAYTFAVSNVESDNTPDIKTLSILKIWLYLIFGAIGLFFGGKLVVDNAIDIAKSLEISEKVVGLTVVAIGTSLPELVTSAVAAFKNKADIAIGNIVGSNIFNIFFVLAISTIIRPIPFIDALNVDVLILISISVILFLIMFTGKKRVIDRWESIFLVAIYVAYMFFILLRG